MRKALVALLFALGAVCFVLVLTGTPFAPAALKKSSLPKQLRDDITLAKESKKESPIMVVFSHQDSFYDRPIQVAIRSSRPKAAIYYTLDGSVPGPHSASYTGPIRLDSPEKTVCTVIKAVAVDGGVSSGVQAHSYFMGQDVKGRFSSYVFSLSGDPEDFFGHERGMLVPGKIYEDYMRDTAEPAKQVWKRPANYNMHGMDWERPVFVDVFSPDGRKILSQHAGVRVKGESSRGREQKSLRLIARKRYEPKQGKFRYNFFPELVQENGYGAPVAPYDSIVLSTSGSVYANAQLIDPLVMRQARKAGYKYASPTHSAAVFLNGEYYGHAWLGVQMNEDFLKKLCGTPPDEPYEITAAAGHTIFTSDPFLKTEYKLLEYYAGQGMQSDSAYEKVAAMLDPHSLLLYAAIQLYTANADWPRNNVKIWRYTGEHPEGNRFSEGADGRWRYLLFDLEVSMRTEAGNFPRALYSFGSIKDVEKQFPFIAAMLQRRELAHEFANHMCDMAFKHFSEEETAIVARELHDASLNEFRHAATDSIGRGNPDVEAQLRAMLDRIAVFTRERPKYIMRELRELFGYTDFFTIRLDGPGRINTRTDGEGRYFVESSVPIVPLLPKWEAFDHWLVNGQKRTEKILHISGKDAVNGAVAIKLVSRSARPAFYLADAYDRGKICGFSLHNGTQSEKSTWGLYLSDNLNELRKWPAPDMTVSPGGKLDFVGQSYQSTEAMLKVQLNFNPRRNEVVFLSDENGTILDHIVMPEY